MLPKLGPMQQLTTTRFKRKSDGLPIMAQLFAPRSTATGGVEDPYRIVRTGPKSKLKAGDVLIGSSRKRYLMVRGGAEERDGIDGFVFKALELDRAAMVYRAGKTLDTITKRTNDALAEVGKMEYAATPMRQAEDTLRIQYDHYEILTDFPLQVGDNIDKTMVVQQVENRLGVTWARMKDV